MNFFREQEIARRNTRLLTLLFAFAVLVLIGMTNMLIAAVLFSDQLVISGAPANQWSAFSHLNWPLMLTVSGVITLTVGGVVLVNWLRFAKGGNAVAEALGARLSPPNTANSSERMIHNIVAEMALAANMPVPPLYILDQERGINAFAAGVSPATAVVALTRGALEHLTRDELQGVIGHELSHILNGDMRLSIRLAAMLRGITFMSDIGGTLLRSAALNRPHRYRKRQSHDETRVIGMLILGLGLYLLGLLGALMAGAIKASLSKQKEYLADASAVQFTRNPQGMSNALKVIGAYTPGTLVHSARADELSHLFFGQVRHRLWSLFATHPPLSKRIQRLDPHWDGMFIVRRERARVLDDPKTGPYPTRASGDFAEQLSSVNAIGLNASLATANDLDSAPVNTDRLALTVVEDSRDPLGAMSLILALLWRDTSSQQHAEALRRTGIPGLETMVPQRGRELSTLPSTLRLQLVELCLPSLRLLSMPQYQKFKDLLVSFIRADGQIELQEWCLFQLVRHYLDETYHLTKPHKPRYKRLEDVAESVAIALGTLALLSDGNITAAFHKGAQTAGLALELPVTSDLNVPNFGKAIDRLADCYPLLKVTLLKAMAQTASADGLVSADELTLIKAIAAVIDCPVPDQMLPVELRH